jgi:hypothetical protein
MRNSKIRPVNNISFGFQEIPNLLSDARIQNQVKGYYPISFGIFDPGSIKIHSEKKQSLISSIVPGEPYSFNSEEEYLSNYESSYWAISHKKGGWDCLRHLEILKSGCIPLMHDARRIPRDAMFYYPKELLSKCYMEFTRTPFIPDESLLRHLDAWIKKYLTTSALVKNMLDLNGLEINDKHNKILFVDSVLSKQVDYMSAMILNGLLTVYPLSVEIYDKSPEFMFDDYKGDTSQLYGRGFGYARSCKSKNRKLVMSTDLNVNKYSLIVVVNPLQNLNFLRLNKSAFKHKQLVLIDGGDDPVSHEDLTALQEFNCSIFIREGTKE